MSRLTLNYKLLLYKCDFFNISILCFVELALSNHTFYDIARNLLLKRSVHSPYIYYQLTCLIFQLELTGCDPTFEYCWSTVLPVYAGPTVTVSVNVSSLLGRHLGTVLFYSTGDRWQGELWKSLKGIVSQESRNEYMWHKGGAMS